jgi:hypothetical protein
VLVFGYQHPFCGIKMQGRERIMKKNTYARALTILEKDHELRKSINPHDPSLLGLLLAINCLRLYQVQPYPGEKQVGK